MATLAQFITPLTVPDFFGSYWPATAYHTADGPARDSLLGEIPELADAERVLAAFGRPVSLLRRGGPHAQVPTGRDALPLYRAGFTCYLRHVETAFTPLGELLADTATQIGVPADLLSGEIFCSTGTSGVPMHSDFDVNIAVLLSGSKRWRIARNTCIVNQTSMCFPRHRQQPDPTQLEYAHDRFPDEMPADSDDFTVHDGGLVFLPRGWWHETFSSGPCLQLNLVVKGPHWAGLVTEALRRELLREPGWRAFAYGVHAAGTRRELAITELTGLIAEAQRSMAGWDPRSLAARILAPTNPIGIPTHRLM
jgi:hypothetical protein